MTDTKSPAKQKTNDATVAYTADVNAELAESRKTILDEVGVLIKTAVDAQSADRDGTRQVFEKAIQQSVRDDINALADAIQTKLEPDDPEPHVGMVATYYTRDGHVVTMIVSEVGEDGRVNGLAICAEPRKLGSLSKYLAPIVDAELGTEMGQWQPI